MTSGGLLKFSLIWALLFAVGLTVEAFFNLKGQALCELESCLLVSELAHLSHQSMVLLGIAYFALFAGLSALVLRGWRLEGPLGFLAASGLGAEAIFLLRQAFDYQMWCPFCLTVALGVLGSALPVLRHIKGYRIGFGGAILGATVAFYLTNISLTPLQKTAFSAFPPKTASANLILVYSSECPHCHEVLEFCKEVGADIRICPRDKALGLLRTLDLKGVPILIVRELPEIRILQGSGPILAYLKKRFSPNEETPLPGLIIPETGGICSELQPECN